MPQLVATITGTTMEELRRARDAASGADLVEVRLDGADRPDPLAALNGRLRPVIVTCRPRWEGGQFDGSEEERRRILMAALDAGAEFVDVEMRAEFALDLVRARRGRGVIVSAHLFGQTTANLGSLLDALQSTGAEVAKLAVEVGSLRETLPLFELGERSHAGEDAPGHVLIGMGPCGVATRILGARLRNRWTYAGAGVAPGQLPLARLVGEYHVKRIAPDSELYGVTGTPVGHSLSPAMHNAGFAHAGRNAAYVPLEARDADDFVAFAHAMHLSGASVTAPFKVDMLKHVDECEPLATEVGAMNTLIARDGRWIAANTDVVGFVQPLKGRIALKGTRAIVLGAGGAARAVAVALKREGAAVAISARRIQQAREVAHLAGVHTARFPPPPGSWDVLVNATSGGQAGSPIEGTRLDGEIVFDLVYAPPETPLLAQARAAGCLTIGGIEMLIAQAERQFEMWTGSPPPPGLFKQAAQDALRVRTEVGS